MSNGVLDSGGCAGCVKVLYASGNGGSPSQGALGMGGHQARWPREPAGAQCSRGGGWQSW